MPAKELDNPFWDALRANTTIPEDATSLDWTTVGPLKALPAYREFCSFRYAMTISDPATVAFVTSYATGPVIDPLAGSGYWGYLLRQAGIDVAASDARPPKQPWMPVARGGSVAAVREHPARILVLSWPPYEAPIGVRTLRAYRGSRVIYLGEGWGGCCGTDGLFDLLDAEWTETAAHTPIQWPRSHDRVIVYDRRQPTEPTS